MKKTILIIISISIVAAVAFLYVNDVFEPNVGTYISGIGIIVCHNDLQCHHEEAHAIDEQLGYPSQTIEYQAIADYYFPCYGLERNYSEFYAQKYAQWQMGWIELPIKLQEFYAD